MCIYQYTQKPTYANGYLVNRVKSIYLTPALKSLGLLKAIMSSIIGNFSRFKYSNPHFTIYPFTHSLGSSHNPLP